MQFSDLLGKNLKSITVDDDSVSLTDSEDNDYRLYHNQDCCERVYIESIVGDVADLIGNPLLICEEISSGDNEGEPVDESDRNEQYQWTFYKMSTIKGSVTIRFYGTSNGYYSTDVSFEELK